MQKITHLWNVNQFIANLNCSESTKLQSHYIQKCRNLGEEIPLPSQRFGPSVMCPYCGCLWNATNYSIRMLKGKPLSKSIKKIVHFMNKSDKAIPKLRRSLAEKCLKNQTNKLVLKCSTCSQSTQIPLDKPQREKMQKISTESTQSSQKWKKRRIKDKTAGLIIPGMQGTNVNQATEGSIEINKQKVLRTSNFITSEQKLRKLNINRLRAVVNQGFSAPSKKNSLQRFLAELS